MAEKQGNGYKQYIYGVFYSEVEHVFLGYEVLRFLGYEFFKL